MTNISKRNQRRPHPFRTAAQYERAIRPFVKRGADPWRYGELWPEDFRTRVLREGVAIALTHQLFVRDRLFNGTLQDFIRSIFATMAEWGRTADDHDDVECELAWLYDIALPRTTKHGDRPSCYSPSWHCTELQSP